MPPYLKIHPKYVSQLQNCRTVLDDNPVVDLMPRTNHRVITTVLY